MRVVYSVSEFLSVFSLLFLFIIVYLIEFFFCAQRMGPGQSMLCVVNTSRVDVATAAHHFPINPPDVWMHRTAPSLPMERRFNDNL